MDDAVTLEVAWRLYDEITASISAITK